MTNRFMVKALGWLSGGQAMSGRKTTPISSSDVTTKDIDAKPCWQGPSCEADFSRDRGLSSGYYVSHS